jgi:hypothetical protein
MGSAFAALPQSLDTMVKEDPAVVEVAVEVTDP